MIKLLSVPGLRRFPEFNDHEAVWRFEDKKAGLRGFIAIHSEKLGSAVGGTRYWRYKTETEALRDALRLSRAMSYKCALAGVKFGGGKGVIIANSSRGISARQLTAYALIIDGLNGRFHTGEDVGLSQVNADYLRRRSGFIIGSSRFSGDPSPWAALSVFYSIRAVAEKILHKKLNELVVAIKGLGKVGGGLCALLYKNGAQIIGADIDKTTVGKIRRKYPRIRIVEPEKIHRQKVDVYSPCALGVELTPARVSQLHCRVVCGGANNQLNGLTSGLTIARHGIFYVPDYIANSGGLINVADELNKGGYKRRRVEKEVSRVYDRVGKLIKVSIQSKTPPNVIAERMALASLR